MSFLLPEAGLLFWMLLAFGIVFVVLYKYGFPVITSMIEARKRYIDEALEGAKKANEKLATIEQESNALVESAKEKQAEILREAVATRDRIMTDAREKAEAETQKILAEARKQIKQEKDDALNEIRSQIAILSMAVAEKVIGKELEGSARQHEYIERLVDEKIEEEKKTE